MRDTEPPIIDVANLKPFISYLILQYTGTDLTRPVALVTRFLLACAQRARGTGERVVVAQGMQATEFPEAGLQPDEVTGFIYRHSTPPPWVKADPPSDWQNESYELVTIIRWGTYLAIGGGAEFRKRVERWVGGSDRPPFRLVSGLVFEQAFLVGEAKGLWMHGTHQRSRAKADTKNVTGINLHESLSPLEDGSFALSSGRATLADDPSRVALRGTVGTTPRRSVVWNGPAQSFVEFVTAALELLQLIDEKATAGANTPALPQLATSVATLDGISEACEVFLPSADDVRTQPDATDQAVDAAMELEGAIIDVVADSAGPGLQLVLGEQGSEVGRVAVAVKGTGRVVEFKYSAVGAPSDHERLAVLRGALETLDDLTVYYQSGHVIRAGQAFLSQVPVAPFRNWRFEDFSGFDVAMEKPNNANSEIDIHANCGLPTDGSLFGWVAKQYTSGHLICDDGPGEIADFIHLAPDGTLSFIHVKAAHSASASRQVAAGPYEVVASQAQKNLTFLDQQYLVQTLAPTVTSGRAAWENGTRCADRQPFLNALATRSPRMPTKVVIVQPHVRKVSYDLAAVDTGVHGYRLKLLDTLLNGAWSTISQGAGAMLEVVGAL